MIIPLPDFQITRSFRISVYASGLSTFRKYPFWLLNQKGYIIRRYLLSQFLDYHRLRRLNFCVRNGNRCDPSDIVTGNFQPIVSNKLKLYQKCKSDFFFYIYPLIILKLTFYRLFYYNLSLLSVKWSHSFFRPSDCKMNAISNSPISTGLLNLLLNLHIRPINHIVSMGAHNF